MDLSAVHIAHEGTWDHQERLDDARGVNYATDGTVMGIEIMSPRGRGVLLDGLPYPDDVARVMRSVGFRILGSRLARGPRTASSESREY